MMGIGTIMFPPPVGFGAIAATSGYSDPLTISFTNIDEGTVYTLPAPVIGDRFALDSPGIIRKSRGLEIKSVNLQTARIRTLFNLSWTWTNLCDTNLTTMRNLLYNNIGEMYLMADVNKEIWRVIILTPANKIVQQAEHIFNVTLEAQGVLL